MKYKNLHIYINIFVLVLTALFSNVSTEFVFAEPTTTVESTTESTTSSDIINNYCESGKELDVKAQGAILIDEATGSVLYEKNADQKLYPASITKVMTTLLACEYGKFDEIVTHSDNAIHGIGYGSSTMGMQVGEEITLKDALYGIMMCSANETSMAVAEHIAGSVDKFVDMMNEKAKELGCTNTHFANPHGFHDPNHYTTPRDMALIVRAAVQNEDFEKIWSTVVYTLPATNLVKEPRGLYNRAKILDDESQYYYPGILGAKTGFHDDALNTLVSYAGKDDARLICVVMKDAGYQLTYGDTKTLYDYGFSQCKETELYNGDDYSDKVPVYQSYNGKDYFISDVSVAVKENLKKSVPKSIKTSDITATPKLDKNKELPVKKGDVLGKMEIKYGDFKIGSVDIVATESINKLSDDEMAHKEFMNKIGVVGSVILKYGLIPIIVIVLIVAIIVVGKKFAKPKKKKRRKKKKVTTKRPINSDIDIRTIEPKRRKTRTRMVSANRKKVDNIDRNNVNRNPKKRRRTLK